jgi:hypothetical protein
MRSVETVAGGVLVMARRSRSGSAGKQATEYLERILQIATLSAAIIALPVAIFQGRPASAVTALIAVIAGMVLAVVHVWRARLPSGQRRYRWQRWAGTLIAFGSLASLAIACIAPATRGAVLYDILGFRRPEVSQLTIAAGSGHYRIQIPIYNVQDQDDQVDSVTVSVDWNENVDIACESNTAEYQLQDTVIVGAVGKTLRATVSDSSGGLANLSLPATGSLTTYCVGGSLEFTFQPGLIVRARSTALIYVDIPEQIRATHVRITGPVPSTPMPPGPIVADATDIPDPVTGGPESQYSFVVIRSRVTLSSGTARSSCNVVKGIAVNLADLRC